MSQDLNRAARWPWGLAVSMALLLGAYLAGSRGVEGPAPASSLHPTSSEAAASQAPAALAASGASSSAGVAALRPDIASAPKSYAHVTTNSRLDELLAAAAQSDDPDLKAGARWVTILCLSLEGDPPAPSRADMQAIMTENIDYAELEREVAAASKRLASYCATGSSEAKQLKPRKVTGGIEAGYLYRPFKSDQGQDARARPWDAVFLANPAQHPYGLQVVLEHRLKFWVPPEVAGSDVALRWVAQALIERLTGVPQQEQIETAHLCWRRWICPARQRFTPEELAMLERVAQALEQRIRQQRWAELGMR